MISPHCSNSDRNCLIQCRLMLEPELKVYSFVPRGITQAVIPYCAECLDSGPKIWETPKWITEGNGKF